MSFVVIMKRSGGAAKTLDNKLRILKDLIFNIILIGIKISTFQNTGTSIKEKNN